MANEDVYKRQGQIITIGVDQTRGLHIGQIAQYIVHSFGGIGVLHIIIRINIPASGVGVRTVCFHAIKIGGKAQQILTIAGLAGENGPDSIRSAIGQVAGVCPDAAPR